MSIEDGSVEWPQDQSPCVAAARIRMKPEPTRSAVHAKAIGAGLLVSPWHGIVELQSLGLAMRARRMAYETSAHRRTERNGTPMREPTDVTRLSA